MTSTGCTFFMKMFAMARPRPTSSATHMTQGALGYTCQPMKPPTSRITKLIPVLTMTSFSVTGVWLRWLVAGCWPTVAASMVA